ncbi:MAG: class II glutamine amidotransferase [Sphingomonadaceae bacterium]
MCELFAMSSRLDADVNLSLEEFSRHGGLAGPHKDGWGIAYYAERDVRLFKDTRPAADSACVRFIRDNAFASSLVLSHIRRATQGALALRNCQPFVRELGGAMHVFAHNGHLAPKRLRARFAAGTFRPVGETDSEYAFCELLERMRRLWRGARGVPPLAKRLALVTRFARDMRALGPANFLYADGDALFAHGDRRSQPDGRVRAPGLWLLARRCRAGEGSLVAEGLSIGSASGEEQHVALAASVPLTDEPGWRPLDQGELIAARRGKLIGAIR